MGGFFACVVGLGVPFYFCFISFLSLGVCILFLFFSGNKGEEEEEKEMLLIKCDNW